MILKLMRCGDCIHLKKVVHPSKKKLCCTLGKEPTSRACIKFTPDISPIIEDKRVGEEIFKAAPLFNLSPRQLKLLFYLVNHSGLDNAGFSFGDKVYINLSSPYRRKPGPHWRRGYVIWANYRYVMVAMKQENRFAIVTMLNDKETIVKKDEYKAFHNNNLKA